MVPKSRSGRCYSGLPVTTPPALPTQVRLEPVAREQAAVLANLFELYCYDFSGKLLWKQDLGVIDAGYIIRLWPVLFILLGILKMTPCLE